MSTLRNAVKLAAAATFVASSAMASTVDILAMDIKARGDAVMFTVDNNSGQAIKMLTIDLDNADDVRKAVRFNMVNKPHKYKGTFSAGNGGSFEFFDADGDNRAEEIKWTFDGDGLSDGGSFTFNSWILDLGAIKGGIRNDGDRLSVSVMFAEGNGKTIFTKKSGAPIGKATASVAAVPLPASALLLLSGLAGLGAMRRKKS